MEKRLIALVFIALLGGLGGGYGLGYAVYQPQIRNLQEELEFFTSNVEEWRLLHKWRRLYTAEFFEDWESISGKTVETEVFKVKGKISGTSLMGRILISWHVQFPYQMIGPVAPIDIECRLLTAEFHAAYPDWTLNFTRGYPSTDWSYQCRQGSITVKSTLASLMFWDSYKWRFTNMNTEHDPFPF